VVPPMHDGANWAKLPLATREEISAVTFRGIAGETIRAINGGTFDARKDRHQSRVPMDLDEQGWQELVEFLSGSLSELERIKADAAARLEADGERGQRFLAALLGFQTPPGPGLASAG